MAGGRLARAMPSRVRPKAAKRPAGMKNPKVARSKAAAGKPAGKAGKAKLLSGDNPQIAKGYGDAPVQAYIAAIPGWKKEVTRRLDALIVQAVPNVRKAVKWNSPLYGAKDEEAGWFLGLHMYTRYVKVAFFRGAALRPPPPGASKHKHVRYLDIHEDDDLDEGLLVKWIRQASQLPGEVM
jgi:hypothetical protein